MNLFRSYGRGFLLRAGRAELRLLDFHDNAKRSVGHLAFALQLPGRVGAFLCRGTVAAAPQRGGIFRVAGAGQTPF